MAGNCGHTNKHSFGLDGELDNMKCALSKGHDGDHSALHLERGTRFSTEILDTSAFKYMRACKECKKFVSAKKKFCPECFESFKKDAPSYYEGEIEVAWNDTAGRLASEIVPQSPGIEVINSDHLFPEVQQEKQKALEQRLAELEGKLNKLGGATPPEDSSKKDEGEK